MTLEWKHATKKKQYTNGNRAIWLVYQRMQTRVAFGWLSERSGEKTSPAAGLAQSVERLTAEQKVAGSIPGAGPILGVLK